jgi:molecular chaperone DnaJ
MRRSWTTTSAERGAPDQTMNFYMLLGVRREASSEEVRRAYRRLARKYHPDLNPGDPVAADHYRRVTEAYETLVDPERRQRYDAGGEPPGPVVESRFEFAGFDFSARAEGSAASTFGELFADALRGRVAAGTRPERGADLHATLSVSFEEAVRGTDRPLTLTRLERCGPCGGAGFLAGAETHCAMCEGAGEVRGARGHMVFSRVCPGCGGAGLVRRRPCRACGGEGVGVRTDTVTVHVPAGVWDGAQFSLAGEGHAGRAGGGAGDLRITIEVAPHEFYRREGDDLLVEVPVAVHEAALGARVQVPTPEGPVRLRVPPGSQSGQRVRLRGRGLALRDGRRGDLVVTLRLVLPAALDERSRALLREFGELNPENVRKDLGV